MLYRVLDKNIKAVSLNYRGRSEDLIVKDGLVEVENKYLQEYLDSKPEQFVSDKSVSDESESEDKNEENENKEVDHGEDEIDISDLSLPVVAQTPRTNKNKKNEVQN